MANGAAAIAARMPARRSRGTNVWDAARRRLSSATIAAGAGRRLRHRYHRVVAKRDPHDVLGIEPGATPTQIKAAWRTLARRHHPDLIGDDPAASRIATRRMAEINEAYAVLTRNGGPAVRPRSAPAAGTAGRSGRPESEGAPRRGGPPRPRPSRPVTARVDTTETFRPRNQPLRPAGGGPVVRNQPPF